MKDYEITKLILELVDCMAELEILTYNQASALKNKFLGLDLSDILK